MSYDYNQGGSRIAQASDLSGNVGRMLIQRFVPVNSAIDYANLTTHNTQTTSYYPRKSDYRDLDFLEMEPAFTFRTGPNLSAHIPQVATSLNGFDGVDPNARFSQLYNRLIDIGLRATTAQRVIADVTMDHLINIGVTVMPQKLDAHEPTTLALHGVLKIRNPFHAIPAGAQVEYFVPTKDEYRSQNISKCRLYIRPVMLSSLTNFIQDNWSVYRRDPELLFLMNSSATNQSSVGPAMLFHSMIKSHLVAACAVIDHLVATRVLTVNRAINGGAPPGADSPYDAGEFHNDPDYPVEYRRLMRPFYTTPAGQIISENANAGNVRRIEDQYVAPTIAAMLGAIDVPFTDPTDVAGRNFNSAMAQRETRRAFADLREHCISAMFPVPESRTDHRFEVGALFAPAANGRSVHYTASPGNALEFTPNIGSAGGKLLQSTHMNFSTPLMIFHQFMIARTARIAGIAMSGSPKGSQTSISAT